MDSSPWPESSPRNQVQKNQELLQGQKSSEEMLWLPENAEVDSTSAVSVAVQALKMFGNTLSTMSYSVNRSCFNSFDGRRLIAMNKVAKTMKKNRGCYIRKRSWTSTKVTPFIDDAHVWRKYGQKEILNAKYKRNYYRCAHKFDQGCQATKQVQQIEDESPLYKITYNRHHTCNNFLSTPQIILESVNNKDTSILLSFESNVLIDKKQVGSHFPSYTHEESKGALSPLGLKDNQPSLIDFSQPHTITMSDQLGPSLMSMQLEHEDVIPKGLNLPNFEMDHILETIFYCENPFDLAHCELTNFNYSIKI